MRYVFVFFHLALLMVVCACADMTQHFNWLSRPTTSPGDTGTVWVNKGLAGKLSCDQGSIIRETGTTTNLTWTYTNVPSPFPSLQFSLRTEPVSSTMGSFLSTGALAASYTAPASLNYNLTATMTARSTDISIPAASCEVHVPENGAIGILDDGYTRGLVGNVYELAANTPKIPTDLETYPSVEQIVIGELDLPDQAFSLGFPDVPNLNQWFAIGFKGQLIVPSTGTWYFQMGSDDGSNLYIDGHTAANLVINNDGQHAFAYVKNSVHLTAGNHDIYVDWFQGPEYCLGVVLWWSQTNGSLGTNSTGRSNCDSGTMPGAPWQIIPWDSYLRPE